MGLAFAVESVGDLLLGGFTSTFPITVARWRYLAYTRTIFIQFHHVFNPSRRLLQLLLLLNLLSHTRLLILSFLIVLFGITTDWSFFKNEHLWFLLHNSIIKRIPASMCPTLLHLLLLLSNAQNSRIKFLFIIRISLTPSANSLILKPLSLLQFLSGARSLTYFLLRTFERFEKSVHFLICPWLLAYTALSDLTL